MSCRCLVGNSTTNHLGIFTMASPILLKICIRVTQWTLLPPIDFWVSRSQGSKFWDFVEHYNIFFISSAVRWLIKSRILLKSAWVGGSKKIIVMPSGHFVTSWPRDLFLTPWRFKFFLFLTFSFFTQRCLIRAFKSGMSFGWNIGTIDLKIRSGR